MDMGPEFQNLTLADRLQVPSFKTRETRPARRPSNSSEFLSFPTSFSATKRIRSGKDTPNLAILDAIWRKPYQIRRNCHQIRQISLDLGRIRRNLAAIRCFSVVSIGFWFHLKPMPTWRKTDPWNPTLLRVSCELGSCPPDLLLVGCK